MSSRYDEFKKYIALNLRKGYVASEIDRTLFTRYANGEISLIECITRFKHNNYVTREIEERHFKKWLKELGYDKNKKDPYEQDGEMEEV